MEKKKNLKVWQKAGIIIGTMALVGGGGYAVYYTITKGQPATNVASSDSGVEATTLSGESSSITLSEGENLIEKAGIYHVTGTISNGYIHVNADEKDEVKIILDNVSITNENGPAIYIESNGNVYIELVGTNKVSATTNEDLKGAIHSKADLLISGEGSIEITSTIHGIVCKDDLEIDGGNITINAGEDAINTNDSATFKGGDITIKAASDGIHTDGYLEINDGKINVTAAEGLEGTYVKINGGDIAISASDDGINAANKSTDYTVTVEINGGTINIAMGQGDTDGIDSNGNIYINGGTITITGQSPFDYDGEAKYTGGKIVVNGTETTEITNQFAGGGGMGGPQQGGSEMNAPRQGGGRMMNR